MFRHKKIKTKFASEQKKPKYRRDDDIYVYMYVYKPQKMAKVGDWVGFAIFWQRGSQKPSTTQRLNK